MREVLVMKRRVLLLLLPCAAAFMGCERSTLDPGDQTLSPEFARASPVWSSLSGGYFHSCGLTVGGEAYCWGSNAQSQLGDGSNTDSNVPVSVSDPS